MMIPFEGWPKIPRLKNERIIVTEKLDGTNACVIFTKDGEMYCQSRTRFITPQEDNYGFARWCHENREELSKLGYGRHFGEWWGCGIQRSYDLKEKRFSLFNTYRPEYTLPSCVRNVPVLYNGPNEGRKLLEAIEKNLREGGSVAAPGYMNPEGFVVFNCLTKVRYKEPFGK